MENELDTKYLVLKMSDIQELPIDQYNKLCEVVDHIIENYRIALGKNPSKNFVVVSESMKCYNHVYNIVLNEVRNENIDNGTTLRKGS